MATFILKNTTTPVTTAGQLEYNTTNKTLVVGDGTNEIVIAKMNVENNGSFLLTGDIRLSGSIFLGNESADNISALGVFNTNLVPSGLIDIGTTSAPWRTVYANNISGAIYATNGVISGSSQIAGILPTGIVSGSSQVNYTQLSGISNNIVSASTDSNNIDFIISGGSITANIYGGVVSGSTQIVGILSSLNSYTQSNDTTNTTQNNKLSRLEESTASLNTFSGSVLNRFQRIEESTASINLTTASLNGHVTDINVWTASVKEHVVDINQKTGSFESKFTTLQTYTASVDSTIARLRESTASINLFTASNGNTSLNEYTTSVNTLNTLQTTRIDQLAAGTASVNSFTASNGNDSLNYYTASLKTAISLDGANVTVNGNLTVAGTTTAVNSTTVQLGDNIIELNGNGAANGGLYVKDPTAPNTATGSMVWDSTNDYWKAGTLGNETKVLLAGGDNVVTSSAQVVGILTSLNSFSASNGNTSLNSYTQSNDTLNSLQTTRIDQLTAATESVNSFSASTLGHITDINIKTGSFENKFTTLGTYTASIDSKILRIQESTASLNSATASLYSYTASLNNRLNRIEESTSSLNAFSASENTKSETLRLYTASVDTKFSTLQSYTASVDTKFSTLQTLTASVAAQISRLQESTASLNLVTSSLHSYTSSLNNRLNRIEESTSSLNTFSASINGHVVDINTWSASVKGHIVDINEWTGSQKQKDTTLESVTASLNLQTASFNNWTGSVFQPFSTSVDTRLDSLEYTVTILSPGGLEASLLSINSATQSLQLFTQSILGTNDWTASVDTKWNTLGTQSGSWITETESGSFLITASVAGQTLTFTKGNGNTFNILIPTASFFTSSISVSGSITVSGSIANADYIDFNTASAVPAWKSGRVFWDNTDGCLAVYNAEADVTLQVGQENWTRVYNQTAATITNGTPVRISGTHGDVPEIALAQSLAVSGAVNLVNQIIGLATHDIEAGTFGYITTQGLVRGVNTSAYNDGDTLYVSSSAGKLTHIPPPAPYEIIPIGEVVKASPGGSGIIYVAVQQPLDFSDLSSVLVDGTFSDGDMWQYVGSGVNGVWKHKTISEIGLVTTSSFNEHTSSTNIRLTEIESYTSSLKGAIGVSGTNVTVLGNLTVAGTTTTINSTTLNIGDNIIQLNGSGATNAGLVVRDATASTTVSGSLLWDTTNDRWIAGPLGSEAKVLTDGMGVISGSGQLGNYETTGRGIISSSAQIDTLFNLDGIVSSSSQINYTQLSGISNNIVSASTDSNNIDFAITNGNITANLFGGVVSGSAQVIGILSSLNTYTGSNDTTNTAQNNRLTRIEESTSSLNTFTSSINTTIKTKLDTDGVLSGSIQVFGGSNIISASTDSNNIDFIQTGGTLTANLKGGVVSGSSQVNYTQLSGIPSGIISSSAQIDTLFNIDGLVSGSSQINYTQLSGISANIISASSDTANVDMIINGGSISANLFGGVVSGSAQVVALLPTGTVSGSIQVLGSSTVLSGSNQVYVSTINQGLGTTSTGVQFATLGVGGAPDATYEFKVTGDIGATGDIVAYVSSDKRLKNNIQPIKDSLNKVEKIGGYSFEWNEELQKARKGSDIGVIAQEVKEIVPEIVFERENGYLAVDYEKIVPLLIEAIKELSAKVKELENK